ncbi:hypothetical protein AK88_05567 [Plasmodium fragile]|uniref:CD99 antigen n=1 Tax=Plasmodium fragile TaxID=5857 RepID=A0A0D9QCM2_PLAFR|nr:uncharacterized protein AK88_05567 [Plasmodium fragile]KJP84800.1 hypothetical protein AK88_05567 [Plasmodium fragile]
MHLCLTTFPAGAQGADRQPTQGSGDPPVTPSTASDPAVPAPAAAAESASTSSGSATASTTPSDPITGTEDNKVPTTLADTSSVKDKGQTGLSGPSGPRGPAGKDGEARKPADGADARVDGGTDDPPPLNPPKPNPNPNQSGSEGGPTSGEASTGGTEHGGGGGPGAPGGGGRGSGSSSSSASEPSSPGSTGLQNPGSSSPASPPSGTNDHDTGPNTTNGDNDFGLGSEPPTADGELGGNYGPRTPQVAHTVVPTNVPSNDGGPEAPDLTGVVLTATTPVLFFLTSVIVALLGYSLWKVSAHNLTHNHTTRTRQPQQHSKRLR